MCTKSGPCTGILYTGKAGMYKIPALFFNATDFVHAHLGRVQKSGVFFISPKFVHATFSKVQKLELVDTFFYKSDFC